MKVFTSYFSCFSPCYSSFLFDIFLITVSKLYKLSVDVMPSVLSVKRMKELDVSLSNDHDAPSDAKSVSKLVSKVSDDFESPVLPGLPDDVSKLCLALVPRSNFPAMGAVSKRWRTFIKSKEFFTVRKLEGLLEECLYVLFADSKGEESYWEVLDCYGQKRHRLPPMPGPLKAGFGVVVLNGKLLVISGYSIVDGAASVSGDVFQYDSCLGSWSTLASINVPRYDFACAELDGKIYAVGGCGTDGESLSSAEMFDPDTNKWILIKSLRRPRWGCFACGFQGKLYIMGGRSNYTIGNSRAVDVYSPKTRTWDQMKSGCVMVTAHAVLGNKLCCMEWKNERKLAIFDSSDNSWKMILVPVMGSSSIGFRFGVLNGKLLLLSVQNDPDYRTLVYDPNASPGCEWQTTDIRAQGWCLCCVTVLA